MTVRPQKITFGEMREMGIRGLLVYCADYRCGHSIAVEHRFICVGAASATS
jgi:hypothetical protein